MNLRAGLIGGVLCSLLCFVADGKAGTHEVDHQLSDTRYTLNSYNYTSKHFVIYHLYRAQHFNQRVNEGDAGDTLVSLNSYGHTGRQ